MIPLPYKLGGIIIAIMGVFSFGVLEGYTHEHRKFEDFKREVQVAAEVQQHKVEEEKKKDETITSDITSRYKSAIAGLQQLDTSGYGVHTIPKASNGIDGSSSYAALVVECRQTTVQLNYLQEWVKEQYKEDQ